MPGKAGQRGQEGVAGTSDQKSDRGGEEGTPEKRTKVLRFGDLGSKRRKPERAGRRIHLPSKCNYGRFYAGQQEFSFSLQPPFLLLSLNPKKVTILFKQRKSLHGPLCMSLQGQKLRTEKMSLTPSRLREKKIQTKIKVKVSTLE